MTGEVIKSFLVGLGFGVDDTSLAKFNKAIASAGLRVAALYGTIKASAAGIFYSIAKISEGFEEVGYNLRLVAPAINKMLILRQAMLDAYRRAGIDLTKVVRQSILFNYSLAKTKFALEAVYKSVGARFLPMLTKQMDIFRLKIFANMPKIQDTLEKFVKFIFKAFEATTILGARIWSILGRVYDGLVKLDEATGGWSTKILAFIAIWKFLNLAFLATPLGMILTGLLAIISLYDDFKVWQEGGQSLINWGSQATRIVLGIVAAVSSFVAIIGSIIAITKAWAAVQWLVNIALTANPIGLIIAGVAALIALLTALAAKMGYLKGVGEFFSNLGGKVEDFFGGSQAQPNLNAVMQPQPLMPQNSGVNQRVNQETNILVQGSADALATGKAVAGEQGKVNFDLTRNLRGATR